MRARPGVLCTHTTVRSGWRRWAINGDVTSEVRHGSSRLRSTTSTIGHPARSASIDGFVSRPRAAESPATVGHGDTSTTGAPARRARSTTTSRACHVGLRSSCSASSCSSTTTTAARSGHGAHAADRAPMTTSTPAGGRRPLLRGVGDGQTRPPQPDRVDTGPVRRRHDDQRRAQARGRGDDRDGVAPRCEPHRSPSLREQVGGARMHRIDPGPRRPSGRQADDVRRRAGAHEERAQSTRCPAHGRPAGEVDQIGRRARAN